MQDIDAWKFVLFTRDKIKVLAWTSLILIESIYFNIDQLTYTPFP